MTGTLIRLALHRSLTQIQYVRAVRPRQASGLVARVYHQVERDFGMLAPPIALHSPAAGPLAASWVVLRESLLARGMVDRTTKEAVAAAVSLGNSCPYCAEVHGATLHGLLRGPDTQAIAEDKIECVADPGLRDLAVWARASGTRTISGHAAPFPTEQTPELVGVAVTFHYLNRMVNVFLGDSPLPPTLPRAARNRALHMLGRFMRPLAGGSHQPGTSLEMLAAASADGPAWATTSPTIADAFARAAAAIEVAGRRSVPAAVRELVAAELDAWDGRPTGPSRAWVYDKTAGLHAYERPAGRLALLTAMASYQVDQSVIDEFRRTQLGDATLVELTSWASMTAALRAGRVTPIPTTEPEARTNPRSEKITKGVHPGVR
jgi:AhpD family alkylhydroperoxidase